jgi:predicted HAD superfamily Cof-like phosphohydrolase
MTQADFFAEVNQRLDRLEASMMEKFGNRRMTTRERIRNFNKAFGRPVNDSYTPVDIETRELLGKLLLEEAVEYVVKGLGCDVKIDIEAGRPKDEGYFRVEHREGVQLDPLEITDGLADVNVVIHFNSHWHGINLDRATEIVDDSNMSKLDPHGLPIINGVTVGYRAMGWDGWAATPAESKYDSTKPIGKILKGPDFYPPTAYLSELIATAGNNAEDS